MKVAKATPWQWATELFGLAATLVVFGQVMSLQFGVSVLLSGLICFILMLRFRERRQQLLIFIVLPLLTLSFWWLRGLERYICPLISFGVSLNAISFYRMAFGKDILSNTKQLTADNTPIS